MSALLKRLLTGLTIPQEYVCVDVNSFQNPLTVLLSDEGGKQINVTASHLFLGYKPLLVGLPFTQTEDDSVVKHNDQIKLSFEMVGHLVATVALTKIEKRIFGTGGISLFKGEYGSHSFLNPLHQWANTIRGKFRKQTPGNIDLPGNLLDQVRIAYSVPRIISVVTIGEGNQINMFPTDLHGPIGEQYYASSLRITGKANDQVSQYKRLVISQVSADCFKEVYGLGKNHMMDLRDISNFSIHPQKSNYYGYPLPIGVQKYVELEQIDFLDFGIHRIHLYKVQSRHTIEKNSTLGHIHQYYAQWRKDKGLHTQFFLR